MLTTVDKVIALQNVDIFSQVSTEELGFLAAIAAEESHPRGTVIYGDPGFTVVIPVVPPAPAQAP